jgi:hypothetical protein
VAITRLRVRRRAVPFIIILPPTREMESKSSPQAQKNVNAGKGRRAAPPAGRSATRLTSHGSHTRPCDSD